MTSTKIQFNSRAYHKAIFHAAKYPQFAVNGVFTGYFNTDTHTTYITDAFPLFHSQITLTPLLEAAMLQIESFLKSKQQKHQILGYYFANEHLEDETMSAFHQAIATKIHQSSDSCAVVFMIDNLRLEPNQLSSHFAMKQFVPVGNQWQLVDHSSSSSSSNKAVSMTWVQGSKTDHEVLDAVIFEHVRNLMDRGAFHKLVDFEQHVDHLEYDYTNPDI